MRIQLLLLSILTIGCINPKQADNDKNYVPNDSTSDNLRQVNNLVEIDLLKSKSKIEETRNSLSNVTGDFIEFKNFAEHLDKFDLYTITTTADYLKVFLSKAQENYRDSTYLYFLKTFYRVANNQTDSLYSKYPATMKKLDENISDADTQSFDEFLNLFGIGLFMTEGIYYLDVNSDYFLSIFDNKVSKGLNGYLNLRSEELNEGFSEDAGLIISFDKVYDRVLKWETLIQEYPNFIMIDEANYYLEIYLETLLTGMDNSRVFDFEDEKLIPEVRAIYDSVIKANADSRSTRIIKGYYELLAQNDFKYSEKLDNYLKQNGLSSMLGIQPHSR